MKNTAVLLFSIPIPLARKGVVAAFPNFWSLTTAVSCTPTITWTVTETCSGRDWSGIWMGFDIPISDFHEHFKPVADRFMIRYHLAPTKYRPRMGILVST